MYDSSPLTLLILLLLAVGVLARKTIWKFSLGRFWGGSTGSAGADYDSEILGYYSAGHMLMPASRSDLNGMKYSTFITTPSIDTNAYVDSIAAICVLDLPFNTQAHLLGLSKQHKIDRVAFESFLKSNGMVKIDLEGDFQDYCDLYAAEGQEVAARVVMNPKSMEFVVDYCRSHFWEINNAELYIVATDMDKGHENLIEQSQQFVDQVKPALLPGDLGAAPVRHDTPYGEYDGPPLPCPICRKPMTIQDNWLFCGEGHGVLIDGEDLIRLHEGQLKIPADPGKAVKHDPFACPNCQQPMESVNYEETGTTISVCTNCHFRWLDANAVSKLAPKPEN